MVCLGKQVPVAPDIVLRPAIPSFLKTGWHAFLKIDPKVQRTFPALLEATGAPKGIHSNFIALIAPHALQPLYVCTHCRHALTPLSTELTVRYCYSILFSRQAQERPPGRRGKAAACVAGGQLSSKRACSVIHCSERSI